MLLFEVGDLIQKYGTGEVGIVVEQVQINDFSYSSLGIPQAYESMMRVRTGTQIKKIPAYRVRTVEGVWMWEHREARLITPRPSTKPEECP
tara:strand:- start:577 stop:849 length:273 start_codon:yes stop_codon:yes gene_type:complete